MVIVRNTQACGSVLSSTYTQDVAPAKAQHTVGVQSREPTFTPLGHWEVQ